MGLFSCMSIIKLYMIVRILYKQALCTSAENPISKDDFEKRNTLMLAVENVDCSSACAPVGSCNFKDYSRLSDEDRVDLLNSIVKKNDTICIKRDKCSDKERVNFLTYKSEHAYQVEGPSYPSFKIDSCCIYGHHRMSFDPLPDCRGSQIGHRRICTCRKRGYADPTTKTSSAIEMHTETATKDILVYIVIVAVSLCVLMMIIIAFCFFLIRRRDINKNRQDNKRCKCDQHSSTTPSLYGHSSKGGTDRTIGSVTSKQSKAKEEKVQFDDLKIKPKKQGLRKMFGTPKSPKPVPAIVYSGQTNSYTDDTYYEEVK